MTSSCHSHQNSECKHSSFPVLSDDRKCGGMKIDNISPSENARSMLTQLRGKEKVGKGKCKNHGHSIYNVTKNNTISSNDVTSLSENVNKLVARKHHIRVGWSFIPRTGAFEYMGNIYNQTYINFAFMLVVLTSVIKRMITINSPKRSRITGLPSARRQECVGNNSHTAHLFHPRLLRALMIVTTGFWIKSSSCILRVMFGKQKQQITRDRAVFKNKVIKQRDYSYASNHSSLLLCLATRERSTGNAFGVKIFKILYIPVHCLICILPKLIHYIYGKSRF